MRKHINENGYPLNPQIINRGGQNRYTYGFEYKIVPLNTTLSQKGNDRDMRDDWRDNYEDKIYLSHRVIGISVMDKKEHIGRVCSFTYKDESGTKVKWIWIFDEDTMKKVPLIPSKTQHYVDIYRHSSARMNPFSTNMGHLRECDNITDILGEEVSKWRDMIHSQLKLSDCLMKYMDGKFMFNKFNKKEIIADNFKRDDFYKLLGLSDNSEINEVKRTFRNFIENYYFFIGKKNEPVKVKVTEESVSIRNNEDEPVIKLESWVHMFSFIISILMSRNENRKLSGNKKLVNGTDEFSVTFRLVMDEIIPYMDMTRDGKRIYIDR